MRCEMETNEGRRAAGPLTHLITRRRLRGMDETDTDAAQRDTERIMAALRESTTAIVLPEGSLEFVALTGTEDGWEAPDWRDYESAVRR